MTDEERAALTRIVRDHEEGRLLLWINDDVVQAISAALAEVDYCHALLVDLQQDSAAYQRGLEDSVKQKRGCCLTCDGKGYVQEEADMTSYASSCPVRISLLKQPCPSCRPGTSSAGMLSPAPVE